MSKQRVFIAGHRGMVGSAIRRQLEQRGDVELVLRTRDELNCWTAAPCMISLPANALATVYLAAAKVGRHCCQQHLSGGFHLPEHDD